MATEVVMPKLGLTMEVGTIGAWLAEEGQEVKKGAPLLEVITDKVTMEVEAQANGILRRIFVPEGEEVPVSTPIGVIAAADEDISAFDEAGGGVPDEASPAPTADSVLQDTAPSPSASQPPGPPQIDNQGPITGRRPHRASPKARKMAAEAGIDLEQLNGSGPGGRIVSADVASYRPTPSVAPASVQAPTEPRDAGGATVLSLTRLQEVAAERLTQSYQQTPHIQLTMEVSAVWLRQFRQGYQIEGHKVSFNDLIVKAVGKTLKEQPRLNSVWVGEEIHMQHDVHIGVAVDTPAGLLVPVIRDVPEKDAIALAAESARLVDAARQGRLAPDEMAGGTFTISNLGMFGVSHFTAIINPPQVAILAVGAVEDRVVALEGGAMAVRPRMSMTLAADHRVVDGAVGARFLARLKEVLETPGLLG